MKTGMGRIHFLDQKAWKLPKLRGKVCTIRPEEEENYLWQE